MDWCLQQRPLFRYALAVAVTALFGLLRWLMPHVLSRAPYLGFYPAVVMAAALGGVGAGLVATFVSLLLVNFVFARFDLLDYGLQTRNLIWILGSTAVSLLAGGLATARRRAAADAAAARAAEQTMRESEERFRALVTATSDVVYRVSPDWSEMRQLHGRDFIADTLEPSRTWLQKYIHSDDQPQVMAVINEAIRNKRVFELEHRVLRLDGSLGWTFSRAVPLLDENGEIIEWFGTASDVTARRESEEALRRRAEEMERLLEVVPAAVWVATDPQCLSIIGNRRANELYEAEHGENVSATASPETRLYFAEDGRELSPDELPMQVAAAANRDVRDYELLVESPSGRRFAVLGNAAPLRDERGEVRGCIGAFIDITARRRAEQALRESEHRLVLAKDAAELGIHDYDLASGTIQWDASMRRLWDVPEDEPVTYETFMSGIHPDDRTAVQAEMDRALSPQGDGKYRSEYRVRSRADGVERWIAATGNVFFQQGRAVRLVGTVQDVTERKRTQELLIRSEKVAALGRMAASLAHDINNPLSAVMNTLFLARSNPECDACPHAVRQYLQTADEELRRISHITHQALGFYREGNAPARVAIRAILDETFDVFKGKIKAKRATVKKDYAGEVVEVIGISGELRQVFSNLVANSLDAVDQSGTIKLRVSSSPDRGVRVTVADDGNGIERAVMPRIFEPLFTTKGSVGTGLGLWVTKQLVNKHGGSIRVRSRVDGPRRGTTFIVALPAAEAQRRHTATVDVAIQVG